MKFTTLPCLLAVAGYALAEANAEPELVQAQRLEERQGAAVVAPAATQAPVQYPSITTQWLESTIASTTTWIQVVYTQQFSAVPDQLPTAIPGSIGYGTLTKHAKRDEPVETDYLQPIVIEVLEEVVTQWVQAVEEVLVLHTHFVVDNRTLYGNSSYGNWTLGNSTVGNGTSSDATSLLNGTYIDINGTYSNTTTVNTRNTNEMNSSTSPSSAAGIPGLNFTF